MIPRYVESAAQWIGRLLRIRWAFALVSAAVFLVLNGAMFGWAFIAGKGVILSGEDMVTEIVPWFAFEAREFHQWHIPLWNPHCFCGMPFVANMSSACCYPFHWLIAVL